MTRFLNAALGLLVALATFTPARAVENTWDPSVQVSATVQSSPAKITLSWPQDTNGTPSSYTIFRKSPTSTDWGSGTTVAGSSTSYTDSGVASGAAYEYRIVKAASSYTGYGYITAGVQASLVDSRGKVVLVVDNSFTSSLASELARLEQDLRGDGWTVVRRDVSRTDSVASVKAVIKSVYDSDPANVKSVFLFGHVPVPYSGQLNPDGHPDHVGAWPADAFYGDMDGSWTDNSVNFAQTINTDPADRARISNFPGDGKFDQSTLPSTIELEVGRVDLANMPVRLQWGGPATVANETELLRKYLNKDNNFRHGRTNTPRRAVIGDYFGVRGGEAFGASAFRSFAPLVGANNVRSLNIEFNDQRGVWIPQLKQNDYLLAFGCGAGSYDSISGLGSGLYNVAYTPELVQNNVRGVFNLLFGSWLGDWDHEDNFLRAPLLTDTGLASVWSGRPHWFMHSLGLGSTLGEVARLTQNNKGQYQTVINASQNNIHIALMGDPTLRLHPVAPASNLSGSVSGSTLSLSWAASPDSNIVGYHVYRAASTTGGYTRLTSSPVTATSYSDSSASAGATYMVRAVKLETASAGSYYNAAQGVFYTVGGSNNPTTPPPAPTPAPTVDSTAPSVAIATPTLDSTVSGSSLAVTANASDNVAVAGVQFKLDGASLGSEDTAAPYSATLNTTTLTNGTHTVSAVARDAAGNMASAATVSFTVNNSTATTPPPTTTTPAPTTTTPPVATTSPTTTNGADTVWFDDALPAGAGGIASGGDAWNWVSASPAPFSGTKAHQSNLVSGFHEHAFGWGAGLSIKTGDTIYTYVYVDPANAPKQIMFSFCADNWEHRA
ncbi:MAG TPA: Ig-like domain-containing protein, partial [Opitutaceae bacterium]|nr:Ig-like domain-containing protein [Opitutaceae bacterium]